VRKNSDYLVSKVYFKFSSFKNFQFKTISVCTKTKTKMSFFFFFCSGYLDLWEDSSGVFSSAWKKRFFVIEVTNYCFGGACRKRFINWLLFCALLEENKTIVVLS
jgi:hypothetical protein